jgi:putative methionine-R-sulfoxide reductase with GAF domain
VAIQPYEVKPTHETGGTRMQGNNIEQTNDLTACLTLISFLLSTPTASDDLVEETLGELLSIICQRIGAPEIIGALAISLPSDTEPVKTFALSWPPATQQHKARSEANRADLDGRFGLLDVVRRRASDEIIPDLKRKAPPERPHYQHSQAARRWSAHSALAVPILAGTNTNEKKAIGAIDIASSKGGAFGRYDLIWLKPIADMLAVWALHRGDARHTKTVFADDALLEQLLRRADIDGVLDRLLHIAAQATNLPDVYVAVLLLDEGRVIAKGALNIVGGREVARGVEGAGDWSRERGITGRALRTRKVQVVPDVHADPDYFEGPRAIKAELVIPIARSREDATLIGALDIQTSAQVTDPFPTEVVQSITSLGETLSLALYTAQQAESLQRAQDALEKLANVGPSAIQSLNPRRVYDLILQAALSLLPAADSCQILLVDYDPRHTRPQLVVEFSLPNEQHSQEARSGLRERSSEKLRFGIEQGVTGKAAREGQTQYIPNVRHLDPHEYIIFRSQTRAELAIPLVQNNRVLAVLNVESEREDAFSSRDIRIAGLLASQAFYAISNSQNYTRTIESLSLLAEVTERVVAAQGNRTQLFDAIIHGAMRVTGAEDGYCAVLIVEDGLIRIEQQWSPNLINEQRTNWPLGQGLTGRAIQEKQTVYVPDIRSDPAYIRATPSSLSNLVVPLLDGDEAVGAISLEAPIVNAFDEQARQTLERLGPPVVAALINDRLVRSLEGQKQQTIALVEQVAHQLWTPVTDLADIARKLSRDQSLPPSVQGMYNAIDFLQIEVRWLDAQAKVLGEPDHKLPKQDIDLRELANETAHAYSFYAGLRKRVTVIGPEPGAPVFANINREEVQGALVELISNAVKYSPETGKVWVLVKSAFNEVEIGVEDEGRGVPLGEWGQIFNRDYRGSNVGKVRGTGLGLYFVQQAMERQGGIALIESRRVQGKIVEGGRFVLKLPVVT